VAVAPAPPDAGDHGRVIAIPTWLVAAALAAVLLLPVLLLYS